MTPHDALFIETWPRATRAFPSKPVLPERARAELLPHFLWRTRIPTRSLLVACDFIGIGGSVGLLRRLVCGLLRWRRLLFRTRARDLGQRRGDDKRQRNQGFLEITCDFRGLHIHRRALVCPGVKRFRFFRLNLPNERWLERRYFCCARLLGVALRQTHPHRVGQFRRTCWQNRAANDGHHTGPADMRPLHQQLRSLLLGVRDKRSCFLRHEHQSDYHGLNGRVEQVQDSLPLVFQF